MKSLISCRLLDKIICNAGLQYSLQEIGNIPIHDILSVFTKEPPSLKPFSVHVKIPINGKTEVKNKLMLLIVFTMTDTLF